MIPAAVAFRLNGHNGKDNDHCSSSSSSSSSSNNSSNDNSINNNTAFYEDNDSGLGAARTSYLNSSVFFITLAIFSILTGALITGIIAVALSFATTYYIRKSLMTSVLPVVVDRQAVLVTGCSSGIGRSTALALASMGFIVFAGVRKAADGEALKVAAATAAGQPQQQAAAAAHRIVILILDVTQQADVRAAVATVTTVLAARSATLVAVCNIAGYCEVAPLELLRVENMRYQLDVNLIGPAVVAAAFLPLLRASYQSSSSSPSSSSQQQQQHPRRRSRLIFISSAQGIATAAGTSIYSASKRGIEAIADGYRQECEKFGVDTVVIQFGSVNNTELYLTGTANKLDNIDYGKQLAATGAIEAEVFASYRLSLIKHHHVVRSMHRRNNNSLAAATATVIETILSSRPLTRYISGSDVSLLIPLLRRLPDRFTDALLAKAFN